MGKFLEPTYLSLVCKRLLDSGYLSIAAPLPQHLVDGTRVLAVDELGDVRPRRIFTGLSWLAHAAPLSFGLLGKHALQHTSWVDLAQTPSQSHHAER